jgi:CubicO group peptidase (beta-lactamase class C family)
MQLFRAHMSSHRVLAVLFFLAIGLCGESRAASSERQKAVESNLSDPIRIKGVEKPGMLLAREMAAHEVPGVSIAVIRNAKVDWAAGYGVTVLGGSSVTNKTMFAAASISKPVTALGVLKLVQEKKIDLDTDVNLYLKRWKIPENKFTAGHRVTAHELLSHTSGIGTHLGGVYDPHQPLPTLSQLLKGEKPAKTDPVRVEGVPGTKFAYSNGGYLVLQMVIEDVSGEPFAAYMQKTVLKPLRMMDSTFEAPLPARFMSSAATAYAGDGTKPIPPSKFYEPNFAAGGLWTTPTDLAKFLIELQREYMGRSSRILNKSMARLMLAPGLGHWGLGIEVGGDPQHPYFTHEGSAFFENVMIMYAKGDGAVIMTSAGGGGTVSKQLLLSASHVYGWPDFKPVEHSVIPVTLEQQSKFVGSYVYIKVALINGFLTAEIPAGSPPQRLYPETDTHFFHLNMPTELYFVEDDAGEVTGLQFVTPRVQTLLKKDK